MSLLKNPRAIKFAGLIVLICLVLIYAGSLLLGFAATVSTFLIRLLEFIGVLGIPVAVCAVLAWFGYKLFIQPVLRQRKLDRIREYRAQRAASHLDEDGRG